MRVNRVRRPLSSSCALEMNERRQPIIIRVRSEALSFQNMDIKLLIKLLSSRIEAMFYWRISTREAPRSTKQVKA